MDERLLEVFQDHVAETCDVILRAARPLERPADVAELADLWERLDIVVRSSAMLSRLLWGQKDKWAAARAPLRRSLGVPDGSPLHDSSLMRNHFEHFDERLDRWWSETGGRAYIDRNIAPVDYPLIAPYDDIEKFRLYDPSTGDVWFWGDRLNIIKLLTEVDRVARVVRAEQQKRMNR